MMDYSIGIFILLVLVIILVYGQQIGKFATQASANMSSNEVADWENWYEAGLPSETQRVLDWQPPVVTTTTSAGANGAPSTTTTTVSQSASSGVAPVSGSLIDKIIGLFSTSTPAKA